MTVKYQNDNNDFNPTNFVISVSKKHLFSDTYPMGEFLLDNWFAISYF